MTRTWLLYNIHTRAFPTLPLDDDERCVVDEIQVYREAINDAGYDDGNVWSFRVEFYDFKRGVYGEGTELVPRVCVFHDAWKAFVEPPVPMMFATLAAAPDEFRTVDAWVTLLRRHGFVDESPALAEGRRLRSSVIGP